MIEQFEKGYSPSAIQHRYGLTYVQGREIADDFKRIIDGREILKKKLVVSKPELRQWVELNFGKVKE